MTQWVAPGLMVAGVVLFLFVLTVYPNPKIGKYLKFCKRGKRLGEATQNPPTTKPSTSYKFPSSIESEDSSDKASQQVRYNTDSLQYT